jgi:hypothetical protein
MNGRKGMVIQLVSVSIRLEQRDGWLELIRGNAAQTRAEEGCESYQISEAWRRRTTSSSSSAGRVWKPKRAPCPAPPPRLDGLF